MYILHYSVYVYSGLVFCNSIYIYINIIVYNTNRRMHAYL